MRTLFAFLLLASTALAHGWAYNDNFIVHTPDSGNDAADQRLAEQIVTKAESYRKQVSLEWFGCELAKGEGETVISVRPRPIGRYDGVTWAKDHPKRTMHMVWIDRDKALGLVLKHEICHTVCATFHPWPRRLPKEFEEQIALCYNTNTTPEYRARLLVELKRLAGVK